MFGEKALIEKIDSKFPIVSNENKLNRVFWSGTLFCHIDNEYPCIIDRRLIYSQIISHNNNGIFNPGMLPYDIFLSEMNKSKFSLDLLGVGYPNKRTFEILSTNTLLIAQHNDIVWPFPEQFSEETVFKNATDYIEKVNKLAQNNELYIKCLTNQQNIVEKYFNVVWIRNYISSYMD